MSERTGGSTTRRDGESTVGPSAASTDRVALATQTAPLVVLLVAAAPAGFGRAVATVGLVLVEALALYVGYGALSRVARPIARDALGNR